MHAKRRVVHVARRAPRRGDSDARARPGRVCALLSSIRVVASAVPMASPVGGPDPAVYGPRAGLLVPLPSVERGVPVVTSASPDGRFFLYTNGTNVIVRDVADPRLACVYAEHAHPVKCAKFSPSGKFIASGGAWGGRDTHA